MTQQIKSKSEFSSDAKGQREYWGLEIESAKKELEKWHKRAKSILKFYKDERGVGDESNSNFNLFYANTGILRSSLYARIPKPTVSRRFNDYDDDISRVAAIILERALSYELENDCLFDTNAKSIIDDRLITGLGSAWLRYDNERETQVQQITEVVSDEFGQPYESVQEQEIDVILDEQTPIEYVHWKDFFWSPARTWSEVRWVARRVYLTKDEIAARFGDDIASQVSLIESEGSKGSGPTNTVLQQSEVFEIWDKQEEKVIWLSLSVDEILDTKDDPFNLPGFFPCPRPLIANATSDNFIPLPDFSLVQDQYTELNELNNRISKLVEACRVIGIYNAEAKELANLLADGRENIVIPVTKWAAHGERGGMSGEIEFMPIQQFATVLVTLQQARDIVKAQLYELTGITDIMRGSSSPYESGAAQKIKASFSSQRLSAIQTDVAEFFSDVVSKKAHLMTRFYEPERLLQRAGILNAADAQLIPQAIALLKNEALSHFRINVSVDSLQLPNFDNEKQERSQALQSIGGFMQSALPMAEKVPELGPLLMGMMKWGVAGYRATKDIEGLFDKSLADLQQRSSQPKPPSPEQIAAQEKDKKAQAEHQLAMAELQLKQTEQQNQFAIDQAKILLERERIALEREKLQVTARQSQFEIEADAIIKNRGLDVKRETAQLNAMISQNATEKAHQNAIMEAKVELVGHQLKAAPLNISSGAAFSAPQN